MTTDATRNDTERQQGSESYADHHMTALTSKSNITFADLGVRDEIVRALLESGKEHPFAIQELTLPLALAGEDLIGQARTGMGKTSRSASRYCTGCPPTRTAR